jgi:hypothetical protein
VKTIRFLGALFALVLVLPAQVVRACNYGTAVFAGWHRCTTDTLPPHYHGITSEGVEFAAGRAIGLMGYAVDVKWKLAPGEARKIDLGASKPIDTGSDSIVNADEVGYPVFAGNKVPLLSTKNDGAGTDLHWRGRPWSSSPMLSVDVWLTAYPGQAFAVGELAITASNPLVPEPVATIPAGGVKLEWSGAGLVIVDGVTFGNLLLGAGETMGNGQSRAWRFVVGWLDRAAMSDIQSALLENSAAIAVNGIARPGLFGAFGPVPHGFDAVKWGHDRLPKARAALLGWDIMRDADGGSIGVSPRAGDTGAQEDQPGVNKGVEDYASPQPGPYLVDYYGGLLSQERRPIHHMEADGSLLDLKAHPNLSLWGGQPNWADTGATDHLGKSRPVTIGGETHGWEQDTEHWFIGRTANAAQLTGTAMSQWELEAQARCFLFTVTIDPRFATSQITDASRAWAWEAVIATWCWELLEDRTLAGMVRQRMHDRVALLYPSRFTWVPKPAEWFDVRNVSEIGGGAAIGGGFTRATLAYQQAQACLMQIAGELLGDTTQQEWAQRMARTSVELGWTQDASTKHWTAWDYVGFNNDGTPLRTDQMQEGAGAHTSGFFDTNWCAVSPWAILRAHPDDARAKSIYAEQQGKPTSAPNHPVRTNDWLLPIGARRQVASDATVTATPVPIAPTK